VVATLNFLMRGNPDHRVEKGGGWREHCFFFSHGLHRHGLPRLGVCKRGATPLQLRVSFPHWRIMSALRSGADSEAESRRSPELVEEEKSAWFEWVTPLEVISADNRPSGCPEPGRKDGD
jgi:hypothetical protein